MQHTSCCSRNNIPFSSYMSKVEYQPFLYLSFFSLPQPHFHKYHEGVFPSNSIIYLLFEKVRHKRDYSINMCSTNNLFNFHHRPAFSTTLLLIRKKINNFMIHFMKKVHFLSPLPFQANSNFSPFRHSKYMAVSLNRMRKSSLQKKIVLESES